MIPVCWRCCVFVCEGGGIGPKTEPIPRPFIKTEGRPLLCWLLVVLQYAVGPIINGLILVHKSWWTWHWTHAGTYAKITCQGTLLVLWTLCEMMGKFSTHL